MPSATILLSALRVNLKTLLLAISTDLDRILIWMYVVSVESDAVSECLFLAHLSKSSG